MAQTVEGLVSVRCQLFRRRANRILLLLQQYNSFHLKVQLIKKEVEGWAGN
jgi:hypothetical protein